MTRSNQRAFCAAAVVGITSVTSAFAGTTTLFSVPLFDHPNGDASANANAADSRDYGLRLDDGNLQTFHFEEVSMTFFAPDGPVDDSTIFAEVSGTIAHLQSSDGVSTGYKGDSGLDATDQRWRMSATFGLIGAEGPLFPPDSVPSSDMLQKLVDGGISSNAITFGLVDLSLAPLFDEPAVYGGPRDFVEKSPGGGGAPFQLTFRHRLDPNVFGSPEWDVIGGNGWVMPDNGHGSNKTRDFLFYTNQVPEPATLVLTLGAVPLLFRRRRTA